MNKISFDRISLDTIDLDTIALDKIKLNTNPSSMGYKETSEYIARKSSEISRDINSFNKQWSNIAKKTKPVSSSIVQPNVTIPNPSKILKKQLLATAILAGATGGGIAAYKHFKGKRSENG